MLDKLDSLSDEVRKFEQLAELIQTMILKLHALGPSGAQQVLKVPRHNCDPTENVARSFYEEGTKIAECRDRREE